MRNFNNLIVPKNLKKKRPTRIFNIRSVAKYQTNRRIGPLGGIEKFSKKKSQSRKGVSHSAEKSEAFCFVIFVKKKLAHTHGFQHEYSGLKSKHLTTRPRTPELCDLLAETRELSPGKKAPALSYNICLSQV